MSDTYDLYKHTLEWLTSLINCWKCQGDDESLALVVRTICDWNAVNWRPPGASRFAWSDHAAAARLKLLCWFWELYRCDDRFDFEFGRLLLGMVYQHALSMTAPALYNPKSNHGLQMDAALLSAAATFTEFRAAAGWRKLAERRLTDYLRDNFSSTGFHMEQTPSYHWYTLSHLGNIASLLRDNDQAVPEMLMGTLRKAAAVWPYLLRADGSLPNVGDNTARLGPADWRERVAHLLDGPVPEPAPSTLPPGHPLAGSFLLDFEVGYAVFTAYQVCHGRPVNDMPDTHLLFRCNSSKGWAHHHIDALSFELYGLGRDWLVDSGRFNYQNEMPERRYMRSARAHNVVLVDGRDFGDHPLTLLDFGRGPNGDFVAVQHDRPQARHTRRVDFVPPYALRITDVLESADGQPHEYSQLFHVVPGLDVEVLPDDQVHICAPDGSRCTIAQRGVVGSWSVIAGQYEPFVQGWYSATFNDLQPSPVLYYTVPATPSRCVFITDIRLFPPP